MLGNNPGNQASRCYIKRRIIKLRPLRTKARISHLINFRRIALLDGNFCPGGELEINRRKGRGHIERYTMGLGNHRQAVGADLVRRVAVGGDAIGPDDDEINHAPLHTMGRHVVGNYGDGDAHLDTFPGGEFGSLETGAGFISKDATQAIFTPCRTNHPDGGSVTSGGETARVAVGEEGQFFGARGENAQGVIADRMAAVEVVGLDGLGGVQEGGADCGGVAAGGLGGVQLAVNGPKKVNGGGAGLAQGLSDRV